MNGARPGELVDRFLARLVDGVLLAVVYAFVSIVAGTATGAASAVFGAVLYLGYFSLMESARGETVGKRVMKLHTLGPDAARPTLEQSARRNIWVAAGILGVIPVVGSTVGGLLELAAVIMIAVGINGDPIHRQGWHDHFAGGTHVVKEG